MMSLVMCRPVAHVAVTAAAAAAVTASATDAPAGDQAREVGNDGVCLPLRRGFAGEEGRCGEHTARGTGGAWKRGCTEHR